MLYLKRHRDQYISKRGLVSHAKKLRRKRRIKKEKLGNLQPRNPKRKKYNTRRRFTSNQKRVISHGANINHIMSLESKINLAKYKSRFSHNSFQKTFSNQVDASRRVEVPEIFSLMDSPQESFDFIYSLFSLLYWQSSKIIIIDYAKCQRIDLDAQVFMDVILNDFFNYMKKCRKHGKRILLQDIHLQNYDKDHIVKVLFSIGTFKLFNGIEIEFKNIVPYDLCIGNKKMKGSEREISSQKEIHTTKLLDYVILCLDRMRRKLTPEASSELCQVVGEILINAEEHSTTDHRFSIGFFEETDSDSHEKHQGVFNLVIFNFGQTIYEKFKDPDCPTRHIVERMKELSEQYTKKGFFKSAEFEEETLWTLYALQEGITSKVNFQKRGNGSIRFIESFFNLKGTGLFKDDVSKLSIHSGNTVIAFDGSYEFKEKAVGDNKFKVIAFNNSGDIEERPDKKYVTFAPEYFPGTMITAKIRISEKDLEKEESD